MAFDVLKSVFFFILSSSLLSCVYFVSCHNYSKYFLENSDVCSYYQGNNKKTIKLNLDSGYNNPSMILSERNYFSHWSGRSQFNCTFIVDVNKDYGLFAVIQEMSLRRNESSNECIDFVQFRHHKSFSLINLSFEWERKSQPGWRKYCGQMKATDIKIQDPDQSVAPNAYIDDKGSIEVEVFIAPKKLLENETLSLEIVFTAFTHCKNDNLRYKSCGGNKCILSEYFNDEKVNCPYVDCKDAGGNCLSNVNGTKLPKFSSGLGSRVTMSAIASVFSVFLVFLSCLWLCRHCGVFCFESSMHPIIVSSPVEMADVHVQPTAPPIADDKDLPPSYDSLFPEER